MATTLVLTLGMAGSASAAPVSVIGASLIANGEGSNPVAVQARFLGDASSLYDNELYLDAPTFVGPIFNNHGTPPNQVAPLGMFTPGAVLFFRNQSFLKPPPGSPASYNFAFFTGTGDIPPNPDRLPHAIVTFDPDDPDAEVIVRFEDQFGGGDLDFNDAVYSFTNVRPKFVDTAIAPVLNPAGSDITVGADDFLSYAGWEDSFANEGTISNEGSVINYGEGFNSGVFDNLNSLFNDLTGQWHNGGQLTNSGTIRSFGELDNDGSVVNAGTLSNAGNATNQGTFTNQQGAVLENAPGGTLENLDEIVNEEAAVLQNQVGGIIRNAVDASIDNQGSLLNAGGTENYGEILSNYISNTGQMDTEGYLEVLLGGAVDNLGDFGIGMGGMVQNAGTFTNQDNATVSNEGELLNLDQLVNDEAATLENTVTGIIRNAVNGTVQNNGSLYNAGGLENYGEIVSNYLENSGSLTSEGLIQVLQGGVLINDSGGMWDNRGRAENAGDVRINGGGVVTGTGTYTQSGGSTEVNGVLDNSITINGGSLSGSGSTGNVEVNAGGRITPGNSPGTLTIDGDLMLVGGSIEIEWDPSGTHDLLDVSGAATFAGGNVNYVFLGLPTPGETFTWLVADGGVFGLETLTFKGLSGPNLRLDTLLEGNAVLLKVSQVPLPAGVWLLGTGLGVLVIRRAGRRYRAA